MREELNKYTDECWDIVNEAQKDVGSRLPGSDGEKKFAKVMADKLEKIGITPKEEEFSVAPRSSIGGIPYAGWVGLVCVVIAFFALNWSYLFIPMFFILLAVWTWLILSVFLYKPWFDFMFKQKLSRNVVGEVLPEDGKYDYTIVLSGHMDTSWCWKHSATNPKTVVPKMIYGVLGMVYLTIIAILGLVVFFDSEALFGEMYLDAYFEARNTWVTVNSFLLCFFVPGIYMITLWNQKDEELASRGAMDNATGIAIAYEATKYFKENPDKMPKNCRIIDLNCGSEEAGLRGSMAYCKQHKDELANTWNINIDSIADKDHFEVVKGDTWQFTHFDKNLEQWFMESMKESGIEKPGNIVNPVGGCDSTPMVKAGVKTITFAAQNPTITQYYHTWMDVSDRFEKETVGTGLDVVLRVIDKIAAEEEKNK